MNQAEVIQSILAALNGIQRVSLSADLLSDLKSIDLRVWDIVDQSGAPADPLPEVTP